MDSGIYIRVGKENKLLEELTSEERENWLEDLSRESLITTIHILCETLYDQENNPNI